ncbi:MULTISPECIES: VirB3 family type IV secretion system protein [unclassified Luteibacter]|uniref:type IV secretion system protein VirB3 n=1 Tax=unclassified Luteibacter TaxID=2620188 RepID=UPI0008C84323|nr:MULTISPECIES: VirB3 family type IV secretion system protein [unclassified Luteibacter]MDR6935023.1 type IV secretion system protein VirB3 [Luteibacter sp. 3190]SEW00282.1 type IV secretion system protein VirB3 [Luteibacter sp. 329MFSha]
MRKDALFRGCTRPPMFMGVPYIPFFLGAGTCLLLAMYFNFWLLLLMPPVILAMRQMARRDEMIFRLLALRLSFRTRVRNVSAHDGAWAFTPNAYRDAAREKRR